MFKVASSRFSGLTLNRVWFHGEGGRWFGRLDAVAAPEGSGGVDGVGARESTDWSAPVFGTVPGSVGASGAAPATLGVSVPSEVAAGRGFREAVRSRLATSISPLRAVRRPRSN